MPLEIKELHVKMVVDEPQRESSERSGVAQAGSVDLDALVAKCVKQILQILKDRDER